MFVEIVNLTDGPGKKPTQVDIYNRVLSPGDSIKIPAELVDHRLRAMADTGQISIGPVPSWYAAAKIHKARILSSEEIRENIAPKRKIIIKEEKGPELPPKVKKPGTVLELHNTPTVLDNGVKLEKRG